MRKIKTLLMAIGLASTLAVGVAVGVTQPNDRPGRANAAVNNASVVTPSSAFNVSGGTITADDNVVWTYGKFTCGYVSYSSSDGAQLGSNKNKLQGFAMSTPKQSFAGKNISSIIFRGYNREGATLKAYDGSSLLGSVDISSSMNDNTINVSSPLKGDLKITLDSKTKKALYFKSLTIKFEEKVVPTGPKVSNIELEQNTIFDTPYEAVDGKTIVLPNAIVTGDADLTDQQKEYTVSIDENNPYATYDALTNTITLNGNVNTESKGTITVTYKTNHIDANGDNLKIVKTINLYKSTYTGVAIDTLTDNYYFTGEQVQLHADVTGKVGDPTYEIKWDSLNPEIATIDSTGKVTAITKGEATFKATAGEFSDTVTLNFVNNEVDSVVAFEGNPNAFDDFSRNNMYTKNNISGFKANTGYIRTKNSIGKKVNKVDVHVSSINGDFADVKSFDLYRSTSSYNDGTKICSFIKNSSDIKENSILTAYINEPLKDCYYTLKAVVDSKANFTNYVFAVDLIKFYETNDPLERIDAELISTNKDKIIQGDAIDKAQFKVTAYRTSGDFYELNSSDYEITNDEMIYNQVSTPVTFTYTEYTVTKTCTVNVDVKMADHLNITCDWSQSNYYEGDDWDLSKIIVKLVYGLDHNELINNPDIKITDIDGVELLKVPSKAQDVKVNVAFTKFGKSFDSSLLVKASEYKVTALIEPKLVATAGKVDYKFGEALDLSGFKFEYTDAYGKSSDVTSSVAPSIKDKTILKELGQIELTGSYKNIISNKININVTNIGAVTESSSQKKTYDMGLNKETKFSSSNDTKTFNGIDWTMKSDSNFSQFEGGNANAFKFGSSKSPAKNTSFTTKGFSNFAVNKVVVPCKLNAAGNNALVSVKIGDTEISAAQKITNAFDNYVFENTDSNLKGEITITFTQDDSKQVYIKSFAIDYLEIVPPTFTAQEQATAYSKYFAKTLGASDMCHLDGNTPIENQNNIKAIWPELEKEYNALGKDAKDLFVIGSDDSDIANAVSFYSVIVNKYQNKLNLKNFMTDSKGNTVISNSNSNITNINDSTALIIALSVAILSVSAIAMFAISKRKKIAR